MILITSPSRPPSVGKTLKAETISEHLHRPFYTGNIHLLQIGLNAADIVDLRGRPGHQSKWPRAEPVWNIRTVEPLEGHLALRWSGSLPGEAVDQWHPPECARLHLPEQARILVRWHHVSLPPIEYRRIDEAVASRIHMPLGLWRAEQVSPERKCGRVIWPRPSPSMEERNCSVDDVDRLARKKLNGREEICFLPRESKISS